MAWRIKTFLLLVCITGACILCLHRVLDPVTSNFTGLRRVHKADINHGSFDQAKVLIDTVKDNIAVQKAKDILNRRRDQNVVAEVDSEHSFKYIDKSSRTRNTKELSGNYVSVSSNGSLLYEVVTSSVASGADQELEYLEPSKTTPTALVEEHARRIEHLQEQCKLIHNVKTNLIGRGNITDFFYTPKYKFAYCKVPKSGSTFWMQLFMVLGRGDRYSKLMSHWTRAQIHERTRRYHVDPFRILRDRLKTVIVARNPFTRVFSAYIDKVFMPIFWPQFQTIPGVRVLDPIFINKTYRVYNVSDVKRPSSVQERNVRQKEVQSNRSNHVLDRPSAQDLRGRYRSHVLAVKGRNSSLFFRNITRFQTKTQLVKVVPVCANFVTFEEFLKFIISKAKQKRNLEPHWAPITHLCRPCRFNTYKIVKQESFAADVEHTLKSFGIELSNYGDLNESLTVRRAELSIPGIIGVLMDKAGAPEIQKCITPKEIAERIWLSFQVQGFISDQIDIPKHRLPDNVKQLKFELIKLASDAAKRSGLTRDQQNAQRRKHLLAAYSQVDPAVIRDIQSIYQLDFRLFDYSNTPPHQEV